MQKFIGASITRIENNGHNVVFYTDKGAFVVTGAPDSIMVASVHQFSTVRAPAPMPPKEVAP